jgi:hypothetical protein
MRPDPYSVHIQYAWNQDADHLSLKKGLAYQKPGAFCAGLMRPHDAVDLYAELMRPHDAVDLYAELMRPHDALAREDGSSYFPAQQRRSAMFAVLLFPNRA